MTNRPLPSLSWSRLYGNQQAPMQRPHRTFGRTVSPTFCAARESGCCWPTIHVGFATQQFGSDRSRDFTPPVPETLRIVDVQSGSGRSFSTLPSHVRLAPDSDWEADITGGRRSAKKPHQRATATPVDVAQHDVLRLLAFDPMAAASAIPVSDFSFILGVVLGAHR